jgi:cell division protein FtsB
MRAMAIRSRIKPPHMGLLSQFVIVLLVIALMGAMAIEPARQLLEQRERISGMETDLTEVQSSNAELRYRIKRLSDPDFVEQRAREQIGLVRPGEQVYAVVPPGRKEQAKDRRARAARKESRAEKAAAATPAKEVDGGFASGILDFIGL